jgi:hypothetical protein
MIPQRAISSQSRTAAFSAIIAENCLPARNFWRILPVLPKRTLSSRGLGHRPFTAVTRVRIPLGSPWDMRGDRGSEFEPRFDCTARQREQKTSRGAIRRDYGRRGQSR